MSVYSITNNQVLGIGINIPEMEIVRNPYCSVSDVEEWIYGFDLDIGANTPEDYEWMTNKAIRRAERAIDQWTMTTFHKVKRREWISGQGEKEIMLDCYPILEVTQMRIFDTVFANAFDYTGDNIVIDNEAGTISFHTRYYTNVSILNPEFSVVGYRFMPGNKNIMVDYWYGFNKVPDTGYYAGIRDCCAKWAAALLLEQAENRKSRGLMSLNVEGQGDQYGKWGMYAQQLKQEAQKEANRYRRITVGGIPY